MGMTVEDCTKMLIAKEKCMKRETSGTDTDCNSHNCDNCSLCYEQGTMGEQKMALLFAVDAMRQYQLMQADYENRLKADMVAMLTEIQLEIEELNMHGPIQLQSYRQRTGRYRQGFERAQNLSTKIIQQKINALKEQNNE